MVRTHIVITRCTGRIMKFEPPTEQEVALYMAAHHYVDPQVAVNEAMKFIGFWESRDWSRGKEKMKSWKGSVATWVGNLPATSLTGQGRMNNMAKVDWLRGEVKK